MLKKKCGLSPNYKIERSNELNKFVPKGWTLTEVRFLAIYQAKINARNPESKTAIFPLDVFCEIMEIKRLNITQMKKTIGSLLSKPIFLPNNKNGFIGISLFTDCEVYQEDNTGQWLVKIECHSKALPYMFEMKRNYFTYELWNALNLNSINQIRMYEILKQYEKIGERTIEIEDLKSMLDIRKNQYSLFKDFRVRVLEACQKALEDYTDIKYTFETIKRGRKIHALKFIITKNENFKDDLKLKEFIKPEDLDDIRDILPAEVSILEEIPVVQEVPIFQEYQEELPQPQKVQPKSPDKDISRMVVRDETVKLYHDLEGVYSVDELINLVHIAEGITAKPEAYVRAVYYQILARGKKVSNMYKYTLGVMISDLKSGKFGSTYAEEEEHSDKMPQATVDYYQRCLFENDLDLTK